MRQIAMLVLVPMAVQMRMLVAVAVFVIGVHVRSSIPQSVQPPHSMPHPAADGSEGGDGRCGMRLGVRLRLADVAAGLPA
jgi:hypothetical protein